MHIFARRRKKKEFGGMASWSNSTIKEHSESINFEVALDLWLCGLLHLNRSTRCPRVWVSPNIHLLFMLLFVLVEMLLNPLLSVAVSSQHDWAPQQGSWGWQQDSDLIDEGCSPTVPEQDRQSRFGDSNKAQLTVWLVVAKEACSYKADLRLSQEVKSAMQDQHQPGTTKAQCIYSRAGASVQHQSQWAEATCLEVSSGTSHSIALFVELSSFCRNLIQGYTAMLYQSRPLTQVPKPVGRGREGLQRCFKTGQGKRSLLV